MITNEELEIFEAYLYKIPDVTFKPAIHVEGLKALIKQARQAIKYRETLVNAREILKKANVHDLESSMAYKVIIETLVDKK